MNGAQADPVTFLLSMLAANFAPLGEEQRLQAIAELMQFRREPGETIDALLSRFMAIRHRAAQGGQGLTMSAEGLAWLILQACGVNHNQLLSILQPFQGRFPNTEAELSAMQMTLRRMGHILEGAPGNIANRLRAPTNARSFFADQGVGMPVPDDGGWDRLSSDNAWGAPTDNSGPTAAAYSQPSTAYHTEDAMDDGTDSDTSSSDGQPIDYGAQDLVGLAPEQIDSHLFWAYSESKRRWRKHMQKPTRHVRRFVKRKYGKGKGKRGAHRFHWVNELNDEDYDSIFFGGKGKSKGRPRISNKGKGRRKNPRGRDGEVMRCHNCGADDHFAAQCPNKGKGKGGASDSSRGPMSVAYVDAGPLSDLLVGSTETSFVTFETGAAVTQPVPPPGWTDYAASSQTAQTSTPAVQMHSTVAEPPPPPWIWESPASSRPPSTITSFEFVGASAYSSLSEPSLLVPEFNPTTAPAAATPVQQPDLEMLLRFRSNLVEQSISAATPQATARLDLPNQMQEFPVLADFEHLGQRHSEARTVARNRSARNRSDQEPLTWSALSTPPGLPVVGLGNVDDQNQLDALTVEFRTYIDGINEMIRQRRDSAQNASHASAPSAAAPGTGEQGSAPSPSAEDPWFAGHDPWASGAASSSTAAHFAAASSDATSSAGHLQTPRERPSCIICMEEFVNGSLTLVLVCGHAFHQTCIDGWMSFGHRSAQYVPRSSHKCVGGQDGALF